MQRLVGPGMAVILFPLLIVVPLGFMLPHDMLFQILNSIIVSTALGSFIMFWEGLWNLLNRRPPLWAGGDLWVIGTESLMLGLVVIFSAFWFYRAHGTPFIVGNSVDAIGRWLVISGLVQNLIASASTTKGIPSRAYRRAGVFVALGIGAALAMASLGTH